MALILYRLPEEKVVHEIVASRVEPITSLSEIGQKPAYVFAPFDIEGPCTTLLFIPDEEHSWMTPNRFSARHIEYTSDETQRYILYQQEFAECIAHLKHDEVDKIVLSRGLQLRMDLTLDTEDLRNLFITACHHYPHSYVALIDYNDQTWIIATPEVLLEEKEGSLRTMALAATMSIEEGGRLKPAEWSSKNRHEQRIVADYIADKLDHLGVDFSSSAVHTKVAGQLVHLCTDFSMDHSYDLGTIIEALHPTPAVCGLPTEKAKRLIRDVEHHDRSYYAGFSGPVDLEAGSHLFVTLRCMQLTTGRAHLYAGGGLLAESDCDSEWVETQRKLKTMLNVLQ